MAPFFRRYPILSITLAVSLVIIAALFSYPTVFCAAYFDLGKLPTVMSYNSIMKSVNQKDVNGLLSMLADKHDDVVAHESAHRRAYGPWAGESYYFTYRTRGRDYAIAGCTPFKFGAPLEVLRRSALAPAELTEADLFVAHFAKSALFVFEFRVAEAVGELASGLFLLLKFLGPPLLLLASLAAFLYVLARSFL